MSDNGERSHWTVQNILFAVTIVITVSGTAIGAYWNIQQTMATQAALIESIKARLDIQEKALALRTDADDRFSAEMRAALAQINAGIADLRVLEAQRGMKK